MPAPKFKEGEEVTYAYLGSEIAREILLLKERAKTL